MPIQDYLVEGLNEEVQRNDHVLLEQTDDSQAMNIELEIRLNLEKEVDELKLVIEKLIAEKASHEDKNLKTVSAEVIEPLFRKIMPEVSFTWCNFWLKFYILQFFLIISF